MKVRDCLVSLDAAGIERLEREVLLATVLGQSRSWLYAHDDESLSATELAAYQQLLAERQAGEPLAYLLGYRDFWRHRFEVSPACLIPRSDTERLVELCLDLVPESPECRILELGTGSGAIAISLALECPDCRITATDVSETALALARRNAQTLGADRIDFRQGDWFDAAAGECFDLIVSNPPYIRCDDPHLLKGDLPAEPALALVAGQDGLEAYRRLIPGSLEHLAATGHLLLEHGHDQRADLVSLCRQAGFTRIRTENDLAANPRVIIAARG